jgi:hypothetical protein
MGRFIELLRRAAVAGAAVSLLAIAVTQLETTRAYAQAAGDGLSQINSGVQSMSYTTGKLDKRVREVRTLVYATLALTLASLVILGYVAMRRPPHDRPATGGGLDLLVRWRREDTLSRLRKHQKELGRALSDLQAFVQHATQRNDELSAVVAAVTRQVQWLDRSIEEQSVNKP